MASEEPRSRQDVVGTSCNRASSAAPECSSLSLQKAKSTGNTEKFRTANENSDVPPGDDFGDPTMPSSENSNQAATSPQATQSDPVPVSPANEQAQAVNAEPEVKNEIDLSQNTALSNIPSHTASPELQPGSNTVKEEMTSSTELLSRANETALSSTDSSRPNTSKDISLRYVRDVAGSTDLATLEAGASVGLAILDELQAPLIDAKQQDLLDMIERIKKKGKPTRTIVSVAGATGAGKSSLINAVLNEEKLLPTNGMRACTAVITEVSYNYDETPNRPYRAEVEFIPKDDWSSELDILFEELVNGNQLCSTYRDTSTEAGIAYAKIRAVYPDLTLEMLVKSSRRQLENRAAVRDVLGTTRTMAFKTAKDLYTTLQKYLDSKEKHPRSKAKINKDEIALWPLIKVVRIYCRADALSTGLCIVDLPGIHDSNAARSAVAKRYMAECTAVWLASPIKRAVDDKAAKELLGQSSRTQFKMDGTYSNVTFICTCSDAIEVSEIEDALDSDGRIGEGQQRKAELSAAMAEKPTIISDLEKKHEEMDLELNASDELLQIWEHISDQHKQGHQVFAPAAVASGPPRKRRRRTARQSNIEALSDQEPLTGDEISNKLEELERKHADEETACDELEERIREAKSTLEDMKREEGDLSMEILKLCRDRRNEWCKNAIRLDFAAGIREQDEEAQQQDDPTFDPSARQRDYDKVARCLAVFTISSKAYQQLRANDGKLRTEAEGFTSTEDTEIPALQTHAKGMTETSQIIAYRAFLNDITQFLGTLQIFANNSDSEILQSSQIGEQERTYEVKVLEGEIVNLKQLVNQDILEVKKGLRGVLHQGPNAKCSSAVSFASKRIEDLVVAWHVKQGEPVGRYMGVGLGWGTYRGTCRRMGAKTPHPRARDFNDEILGPFLTKLSTSWEQAFVKSVPEVLGKFENLSQLSLRVFHDRALGRPALAATRGTSLRMLEQQLPDHLATIRDAIRRAKTTIQSEQRQASRLFYPEVKDQMMCAYEECAQVKGIGTYLRMREIMLLHVQDHKENIYLNSYAAVTAKIDASFDAIAEQLQEEVHTICDTMRRNYMAVISCGQMIEASVVAREHLRDVLSVLDIKFKDIANTQEMQTDSAQAAQSVTEPDTSKDNDNTRDLAMDIDSAKASQPVNEPNTSKGNEIANYQATDVDAGDVTEPTTEHNSPKNKDTANEQAMDIDSTQASQPLDEYNTSKETPEGEAAKP